MAHDDPDAKQVPPGGEDELVWRFTHAGTFDFACLIPGHMELGMLGSSPKVARRSAGLASMPRRIVASLLLAGTLAATLPGHTQETLSEGEVKRVDKSAGKLIIKHGPLANFGMPAMTMVFRVGDPAMLDQVAPGDKSPSWPKRSAVS